MLVSPGDEGDEGDEGDITVTPPSPSSSSSPPVSSTGALTKLAAGIAAEISDAIFPIYSAI